MMEGEGILKKSDGTEIRGTFVANAIDGNFVQIRKDGTKLYGHYSNGVENGTFITRDSRGNIIDRKNYVNGRLVR